MDQQPVSPQWDFFIAHSHNDQQLASNIYNAISKTDYKAFLDKECILPGTPWDDAIVEALKNSRVTIVLISTHINHSYFAREEVQRVIDLTRKNPEFYKIIPIYLDGMPDDLPYGLRLIQGIDLSRLQGDITALVNKLIQNLSGTPRIPAPIADKQHILLSFPPGPLVTLDMIPRPLIDAYSSLITDAESRLVVSEANAFRREATPDTNFIIPLNRITGTTGVASFYFWQDAFQYAGLQGPRMVAALLLVVPDDMFNAKAREARMKLIEQLKNHH